MLVQGNTSYRREPKVSTMLEAIPDLTEIETEKSPRILNTHLPFRWLPRKHIENGGKIVHVVRNPKDVCVSMYHFLLPVKELGVNIHKMTWEQYLNNLVFGEGKR